MRLAHVLVPHLSATRQTVDRAIYGTISVIAVIAGTAHGQESVGRILVFSTGASVVFWAVHVYASVLADIGPARLSWRLAVRKSLRAETGVFGGVVIPLAVLGLGVVGILDEHRAVLWSMWSGVIVLFVTPLVWLRPQRSWGTCLLASTVGGLLGTSLIWSKVVLH